MLITKIRFGVSKNSSKYYVKRNCESVYVATSVYIHNRQHEFGSTNSTVFDCAVMAGLVQHVRKVGDL